MYNCERNGPYLPSNGAEPREENKKEITAKIGLMYPSDYGYATDFEKCKDKFLSQYGIYNGNDGDYNCKNNDYLFTNEYIWFITPNTNSKKDPFFVIGHSGNIYQTGSGVCSGAGNYVTLYLNADEVIGSGEGTKNNPYQISRSHGKYFNGTSDYIDMGYANYDFGNTISVGIRFKVPLDNNNYNKIIVGNPEAAGFELRIIDNKLYFDVYSSSKNNYIGITGGKVNDDKWHTAVGTYDGNTMKLYLDGAKVGTDQKLSENIKKSPLSILIGANPGYNIDSYYKGMISDVFVTSEVLDESIIKEFANSFTYTANDTTYFYQHYN